LIGVNTNSHDPKQLKAVMEKEKMNWRSFADEGTIAEEWNTPGTPMYYVIDHQGVIRYKWYGHPGEKAIETALEKLIKEAEVTQKNMP
jgi:peroxiredoxin